VLGHFLDQDEFVWVGGFVLGAEGSEEKIEFALVLPIEDFEFAGEAVAQIFCEEVCLPVSPRGPVLCCALACIT